MSCLFHRVPPDQRDRDRVRHRAPGWLRNAAGRRALDRRERLILERRMLADSDDELTLTQLGSTLGVSRERVRQLQERVKSKIKMEILREVESVDSPAVELAA